jgi:hypothetical protein
MRHSFIFAILLTAMTASPMPANAQTNRGSPEISPTIPDIHHLPAIDPVRAKYDNACANLAAAVNVGATDLPEFSEWLRQCNDHPNPDECQSVIQSIKEWQKPVPKSLTCHGRGKVQAPTARVDRVKVKGPNDDFDSACENLAAAVGANMKEPIMDDWTQKCNQHPDKEMCKTAIKFIRLANKKVPSGLTCRQ